MLKANPALLLAFIGLTQVGYGQSLDQQLPTGTLQEAPIQPVPSGTAPPTPSAAARQAAEAFARARWGLFLSEQQAANALGASFCQGTAMPADLCPASKDASVVQSTTTAPVNPPAPLPVAEADAVAEPEKAALVGVIRSDAGTIAVYEARSPAAVTRFTATILPGQVTRLPDGRRIAGVTTSETTSCVRYEKPHEQDCLR